MFSCHNKTSCVIKYMKWGSYGNHKTSYSLESAEFFF